MQLLLSNFKECWLEERMYLEGETSYQGTVRTIDVYFSHRIQEKRVFPNSELTLEGELFDEGAERSLQLLQASITKITPLVEFDLDALDLPQRLQALGLTMEFDRCKKRDQHRAHAILEAAGVGQKFIDHLLRIDQDWWRK